MESKSEKFKRLAEARTNKAIASIRSISNLSNPGNYEYDDSQIQRIFSALKRELEESRAAFSRQKPEPDKFKL